MRPDRQVGVYVLDGSKERFRSVPTPSSLLIYIEVANTVIVARIKVVNGLNTSLLRCLGECVEDFPSQPLLLYAPLPCASVNFSDLAGAPTKRRLKHGIKFVIAFMSHEILERVFPRPLRI